MASFAAVRTLPAAGLALLAVILVPIFSFEFTIGFWLLVKLKPHDEYSILFC